MPLVWIVGGGRGCLRLLSRAMASSSFCRSRFMRNCSFAALCCGGSAWRMLRRICRRIGVVIPSMPGRKISPSMLTRVRLAATTTTRPTVVPIRLIHGQRRRLGSKKTARSDMESTGDHNRATPNRNPRTSLDMNEAVIEVRGLRKEYRSSFGRRVITALDGIDISVRPGELFGLLGPNGAGKTTTVKVLLGLTAATAGSARIAGLPVTDPGTRRSVGYLPEGHKIPNYLTARQALSIFGRMSGMETDAIRSRSVELLDKLKLSQWTATRVKSFSRGMPQPLALPGPPTPQPRVLLPDEP